MIHQLKIWPEFFEAVRSGKKTFEIRELDCKVGDTLLLCEYCPKIDDYTGKHSITVDIVYITEFRQMAGYKVLGIRNIRYV